MDLQAMASSTDQMNQGTIFEDTSELTGSTDPFGPDSSHEADGTENAKGGGSDVEDADSKLEERLEAMRELCHQIRGETKWYTKAMHQKDFLEQQAAKVIIEAGTDLEEIIAELRSEARRIYLVDETIRLETPSLPDRQIDWESIGIESKKSEVYLRGSNYGNDEPELSASVGAYTADDMVPELLRNELIRELDALAQFEPKDFRPGSGGRVQNLIHPSLYPYMVNVTPLSSSAKRPSLYDGKFLGNLTSKRVDTDEDNIMFSSSFAWTPSVIQVSEDGANASIDGYISGLGTREHFPTLFRLLEQVFQLALPLLEKTVAHEYPAGEGLSAYENNPAYHRWMKRHEYLNTLKDGGSLADWKRFRDKQRAEKAAKELPAKLARSDRAALKAQERADIASNPAFPELKDSSVWAGRRLKVIIKAVNYILQPGQEYEGNWHLAGMPHERIVASAFYYYDHHASIHDARLHLRRRRDYSDFPQTELKVESLVSHIGDKEVINNPSEYGSDAGLESISACIDVGVIPTMKDDEKTGTGRIITFPNWLQHRIANLHNDEDASGPAIYKLLCFFLVDDGPPFLRDGYDPEEQPGFTNLDNESTNVLTTQDIPSQVQACNLPTIAFLLRVAFRQRVNRTIPYELVEMILGAIRESGTQITREEAEKRRRSLMEERLQTLAEENQWWEDEWELPHEQEWYETH